MTKFAENLTALLERNGINQKELAGKLGISQPSVSGWMNGSLPRHALLKRIAEHFGVSVSSLTDTGSEKSERQTVRFVTAAGECVVCGYDLTVRLPDASGPVPRFDLRTAAEAAGLSINALARQAGVPASTLNRCLVHHQIPYPATLKKIADFFGVSVSDVKRSLSKEANQ
jgi:transcriptional regulator with XRE-family HTH domain